MLDRGLRLSPIPPRTLATLESEHSNCFSVLGLSTGAGQREGARKEFLGKAEASWRHVQPAVSSDVSLPARI